MPAKIEFLDIQTPPYPHHPVAEIEPWDCMNTISHPQIQFLSNHPHAKLK